MAGLLHDMHTPLPCCVTSGTLHIGERKLIPRTLFEVSEKNIRRNTKHASFAINVKSSAETRSKFDVTKESCWAIKNKHGTLFFPVEK